VAILLEEVQEGRSDLDGCPLGLAAGGGGHVACECV